MEKAHPVFPPIILSSALHRLENKAHYDNVEDVYHTAALYGVYLAQGHLFLDANKRTAFMSMYVFLELNGFLLNADDYNPENEQMMEKIAQKQLGEEYLANWLRKNSEKF